VETGPRQKTPKEKDQHPKKRIEQDSPISLESYQVLAQSPDLAVRQTTLPTYITARANYGLYAKFLYEAKLPVVSSTM
jgi:hypothetical protein